MAGTGDVNAVIVADGFTDAATLPSFGGSATGGATALPTNWPHIPVAPPIVEPTAGGDAEPAGPPAATVDPPAGAGSGGAVPLPVNLNPAAIVAPIGAGQGDVTTIPANWPHIPTAPPLVEPSAGATVEPVAPGNITTTTPTATGGGGAEIPPLPPPTIPIAPPIGGAGGGGVPIPVFWDPIIIGPIVGPGIGGGGAFPVPIFPLPIFPPGGGGAGGGVVGPVGPPAVPVQPPVGGGGGGAVPVPGPFNPPAIQPPAGGGGGGGGAVPVGPPHIPIQPPAGGGGGGAIVGPIGISPLPVSPPTGGAIGTDPTILPLPIPTTPVSPPTGTGGGGATTSPVAPTGPGTTAPGGGAGGGGGATPTGPTQVPITAPTGTGTGTGTTAPTLPSVPVTAPTGGAVGGDASTGVGEPIPAATVSAPAATVSTSSTATGISYTSTGSQPVSAPTVSTTTTTSGTTTQTIACKCCGASADPCCGPFPDSGPFFRRWFAFDEQPFGTSLLRRGKTSEPESLTLTFNPGISPLDPTGQQYDLLQDFDIPFEYFDPGPDVALPSPFRRYEIAKYTNNGPIKARLRNQYQWSPPAAGLPDMQKIGNTWISFETDLYLLVGYRIPTVNSRATGVLPVVFTHAPQNPSQNGHAAGGLPLVAASGPAGNAVTSNPYPNTNAVNAFVLLSSLDDLDTDTDLETQIGQASSYKVFFQRWDPDASSVTGQRFVVKTAELTADQFGLPRVFQKTWVRSAGGCPFSIQQAGLFSAAHPFGAPFMFTTQACSGAPCHRFTPRLTLKRRQDCRCPNGYARQLFGADGLCPDLDFGLGPVELQADLTAYTHVAPYSASNTSTPSIPTSLGFLGNTLGTVCLDFAGENVLGYLGSRDVDNKPFYYLRSGFKFELQETGDPVVASLLDNAWNSPNFGTWSELTAWKRIYSTGGILRGPAPVSGPPPLQLQYVSHSCAPFSMTFAGSLWITSQQFGSTTPYDTHIADVEITFSLPSNGLVSMAGPPAQMSNPTTTAAQDLIQQAKTRLALPCIHRGQPLEESASCGCGGAVLTACALYGQCRPYGTATDAQVCTRCPDYAAG